jgi:hypothetical protein
MTTSAAIGNRVGEVCESVCRSAGGYLRNVVRDPGVTCRVCATPVEGFNTCWRCRLDRRASGVADVVAPLSYAIAGTQSAALVRDYKNHPVRAVREADSLIVKQLVFLAISLHERCIAVAAGLPVTLRLTIPSLTSRRGVHPFTNIARELDAVAEAAQLLPTRDALCDRTIRADKFALAPDVKLAGRHVMVLDDSWTTGSNAQSAALTLRRAGASAVSVMVIGRWLNPSFGPTADFIKTRLTQAYDPRVCPITGGRCP